MNAAPPYTFYTKMKKTGVLFPIGIYDNHVHKYCFLIEHSYSLFKPQHQSQYSPAVIFTMPQGFLSSATSNLI